MRMRRYFFTSSDIEALEQFEQDLERAGVIKPQIHVLTNHERDAHRHHVHQVTPFMKTDVVHSTLLGAACGMGLGGLILLVSILAGWTAVNSIPFIFLAIVLLGFCTWVGGFRGIQRSNSRTRRFDQVVRDGRHVFFVDQPRHRAGTLEDTARRYPSITAAGQGHAAPRWLVFSQHHIKRFFSETFP